MINFTDEIDQLCRELKWSRAESIRRWYVHHSEEEGRLEEGKAEDEKLRR